MNQAPTKSTLPREKQPVPFFMGLMNQAPTFIKRLPRRYAPRNDI